MFPHCWPGGSGVTPTSYVMSNTQVSSPSGGGEIDSEANGSAMVGAPDCGAGVIGPVAVPAAWARPAVSVVPLSAVMFWFDCTRQLLAVSTEVFCTSRLSVPLVPELSTHSGISPSVDAVACAFSVQPPGGNMLPKNDGRLPVIATVTLELSAAIVVATLTRSLREIWPSWPTA